MSRETVRGNETGEIIDVGETLREAKITLGEMKATMVNLKAEVAKLRSLFANMSLRMDTFFQPPSRLGSSSALSLIHI